MKTQPHLSLVKTNNESSGFYATTVVRGFEIPSDEPEIHNGTNLAPAPLDYLNTSLASCTASYLRAITNKKGIDVGTIVVKVKIYPNNNEHFIFERTIILEKASLNDELIEYLKKRVEETPITKILKRGHTINTSFTLKT